MSGALLDSVVLSDAGITESKAKQTSKTNMMSFVSPEMVTQTVIATAIATVVYVSQGVIEFPVTAGVLRMVHVVTGMVLGLLLTARVILGVSLTFTASGHVYAFAKACRSIAVLSTSVNETLTVSAGAESEKKAISKFRFELVRLLNLSFYSFTLMLSGNRLAVPPTTLRTTSSSAEEEALSSVPNPTVMVAKLISSLVQQQCAAKRISNEATGVMMGKIGELIDSYHASLAMLMSPAPPGLTAFVYVFTAGWVYFSAAAIAVIELADSTYFHGFGLALTIVYSAFLSVFVFGLYEAGNVAEKPLSAVVALLGTDDMASTLSDDLSKLIGDDAVPVMLPK